MLHREVSPTDMSLERGIVFVEPFSTGETREFHSDRRARAAQHSGVVAVRAMQKAWRTHLYDHPEDTAETITFSQAATLTTIYGDEIGQVMQNLGGSAEHRQRLGRIVRRELRRHARQYFRTPVRIGSLAMSRVSVTAIDNTTLFVLQARPDSFDPGIAELCEQRKCELTMLRNRFDYRGDMARDVGIVLARLHSPPDERQLHHVLRPAAQTMVNQHLSSRPEGAKRPGFWVSRTRLRQRPYISPPLTLAAQAAAFSTRDMGLLESTVRRQADGRLGFTEFWHERPVLPRQTTYDLIMRDSPHLLIPEQQTNRSEPIHPQSTQFS